MLIARYDETYQREQTLRKHCSNVSFMTGEGLKRLGLRELGRLLGWLHDLCKALIEWQAAIKLQKLRYRETGGQTDRQSTGVPHAPPAARLVYALLNPLCHDPSDHLALQIVCMVIYAHHGYLMDALCTDGEMIYQERICSGPQESLEGTDRFFTEVVSKDELFWLWRAACSEVSDYVTRAKAACAFLREEHHDKIKPYGNFMVGMLTRLAYSVLIDADRLDAANFENGILEPIPEKKEPPWDELSEALESGLSKFKPDGLINRMRERISLACLEASAWPEALQKLHAPTGGGKTLASLRWALGCAQLGHKRKIIYVVSYTTILDQVYDEYRRLFQDARGLDILLHHSNLIPDEDTPEDAGSLYLGGADRRSLLAERWDADIILTTQVQFFNALFLGTGKAARRLRSLQDAVIILDEVQTIPIHLTHLFNLAAAWLTGMCGCRLLLSTATQPTLDTLSYPLPPARDVIGNPDDLFTRMKRVTIFDATDRGQMDAAAVAEFVYEKQREHASVLVVLNTREAARKVYDALEGLRSENVALYLLSNDMCVAHRKSVIDDLKKMQGTKDSPGGQVICVSTQLIECGVDLSFDCAVRSLAGADNIWQTAGRCNRHGNEKNELKPVYIIRCSEEKLSHLKDIERAQRACQTVLHYQTNADALQLPETINLYYQAYYREQHGNLSYSLNAGMGAPRQSATMVDLLSSNDVGCRVCRENGGVLPPYPLKQAFRTAGSLFTVIDNPSVSMIVPYKRGAEIIEELSASPSLERQKKLLKEAQLYTINLFRHRLDALGMGAVATLACGVMVLMGEWYDDRKKGLLSEPVYNVDKFMT